MGACCCTHQNRSLQQEPPLRVLTVLFVASICSNCPPQNVSQWPSCCALKEGVELSAPLARYSRRCRGARGTDLLNRIPQLASENQLPLGPAVAGEANLALEFLPPEPGATDPSLQRHAQIEPTGGQLAPLAARRTLGCASASLTLCPFSCWRRNPSSRVDSQLRLRRLPVKYRDGCVREPAQVGRVITGVWSGR